MSRMMRSNMAALIGLLILIGGVVVAFDIQGLGTKVSGLNLYISAPPWSRNPRPRADRIKFHRLLIGSSLVVSGLLVLIAGLAPLI